MKKIILFTLACLLHGFVSNSQITWEKLFSRKSTDAFRNAKEVPTGGYVLAGYTSDSTASDSDAYVVRLNTNGDTLWTFRQNIGLSKKDLFYKVIVASDGGFVMCGYTNSITGISDDILIVKINSSGQLLWTKTWGGTGKDRAQDIIELSDGSFAITGYTTSPPALYYDAFLYKVDSNGDSLWFKRYGTAVYDDANSVRALANGGFLIGGQSANGVTGFDQSLIRTDDSGNVLWSTKIGTPGTDNIEHIAVGSDGYFLAGGTNGAGIGGDDGYLVKTDTSGARLWSKTFGGSQPDDFHRVELTSDGGLILSGTSSSFSPLLPNMWLVHTNITGDSLWSNTYGGDNHDHGYSGQETSDGGYIMAGYSGSFGFNSEEGYVVKTNSTGVVSNHLTYTTATVLIEPNTTLCGGSNSLVKILIKNFGNDTVPNVPATAVISGSLNATLSATYSGALFPQDADTLIFPTAINTSTGGTYTFLLSTLNNNDVFPANNTLTVTVTVDGNSGAPTVTGGSNCGPGTVNLSAGSSGSINWFDVPTGGTALANGTTFTTPSISATTTYYAQTGLNCPSSRVPVVATINTTPNAPTAADSARCGPGTVTLFATSSGSVYWFDVPTGGTALANSSTFITPSLTSSTIYYAQTDLSCPSSRIPVNAIINSVPVAPTAVDSTRCGPGTVNLSVSSSNTVQWYAVSSGGSLLSTGLNYTTPSLTVNTPYYVQAIDANSCISTRTEIIATIGTSLADPIMINGSVCGSGTVTLSTTSSNGIHWYNDAIGTTLLGTGASFTTPFLTATTTYYAQAFDGLCVSGFVAVSATLLTPPIVSIGPDTNIEIPNVYILDPGPGFTNYDWSSGSTLQTLTVFASGMYCVTVTDGNGCINSDCATISFFVSVNSIESNAAFSIYPNPTNENMSISFANTFTKPRIEIVDLSGKIIFNTKIEHADVGTTYQINTSRIASGIYIVKITSDEKQFCRKLVVE